jgi:hypothetical protein
MQSSSTLPPPRAVSPPTSVGRRAQAYGILAALVAMVLLAGAVLLYHFDPGRYGFYPRCHFHVVTGLACPGCGGLRALHALLHGELAVALRLNALVVAGPPAVLVLAGVWFVRRRRDPTARFPLSVGWAAWAAVVVVVLFGLLRNLPAAAQAGFGP